MSTPLAYFALLFWLHSYVLVKATVIVAIPVATLGGFVQHKMTGFLGSDAEWPPKLETVFQNARHHNLIVPPLSMLGGTHPTILTMATDSRFVRMEFVMEDCGAKDGAKMIDTPDGQDGKVWWDNSSIALAPMTEDIEHFVLSPTLKDVVPEDIFANGEAIYIALAPRLSGGSFSLALTICQRAVTVVIKRVDSPEYGLLIVHPDYAGSASRNRLHIDARNTAK